MSCRFEQLTYTRSPTKIKFPDLCAFEPAIEIESSGDRGREQAFSVLSARCEYLELGGTALKWLPTPSYMYVIVLFLSATQLSACRPGHVSPEVPRQEHNLTPLSSFMFPPCHRPIESLQLQSNIDCVRPGLLLLDETEPTPEPTPATGKALWV